MILNIHTLRRGQNCSSPVQFRRVKSHAHVGDKRAEHEDEVGGFDVLPNMLVAAHGAAVNTDVKPMIFGDRAFAQQIGGDGNVHALGHAHDQASGAIARQFDARQNDRLPGGTNQGERFVDRRLERVGIGFFGHAGRNSAYRNFAVHYVVRHFDVNGSFVAQTRFDAADNLRSSTLLIE
jgi:hypothetical protein